MRAKPNADPYKRHKTRHRGASYRERADGSRVYYVFDRVTYVKAGTTEADALASQAQLRSAKGKGEELPRPNDKTTFGQLAETWYEAKAPRLRKRTAGYYRTALDLVLLPRFRDRRLAAINADAIAKLIRDLEREGLHAIDPKRPARPLGRSSIDNYLKPLQAVLALALRRRLIASNPFDVLTTDDRPKREEKEAAHEWTDEELNALLNASRQLARKPEARYDYTPLLRLVAVLGLRLAAKRSASSGRTSTRTRMCCTSGASGSGRASTARRRRRPAIAASR